MSQAVQAKQADRLKKLRDLHIKRVSIIFFLIKLMIKVIDVKYGGVSTLNVNTRTPNLVITLSNNKKSLTCIIVKQD